MAALPATQLRARAVTDRDEIAAYLRTDRRYAAYALGDLDSASRARCSWGIAYDGEREPVALAFGLPAAAGKKPGHRAAGTPSDSGGVAGAGVL